MTITRFPTHRASAPSRVDSTGAPGSRRKAFKSALILSAAGLAIAGAVSITPGAAWAQDVGPGGLAWGCVAGFRTVACAPGSEATTGFGGHAFGWFARATGDSTAVGADAHADGFRSSAFGTNAQALNLNSVAIGANSVADQDNVVSVGGGEAGLRRIVNMADGVEDDDAATVGQMNAGDARTLNDAIEYTRSREALIRDDLAISMALNDAAVLADANAYTDDREELIRTDMAAGDAATLSAANTYADVGDARTLASANLYTDQQFGRLETALNGRFRDVEVRMDQVTAMSAAFAAMSGNNAGSGTEASNRLVVGVGNYGSETAMSVGYSRAISRRTAFNAGVSFTGGEVMSGGSFGFAW